MPNPFDYDRGISHMQHKYQLLYGLELRPKLAPLLRVEPARVHFLNDAAAFLTGELHQGAARGYRNHPGYGRGIGLCGRRQDCLQRPRRPTGRRDLELAL